MVRHLAIWSGEVHRLNSANLKHAPIEHFTMRIFPSAECAGSRIILDIGLGSLAHFGSYSGISFAIRSHRVRSLGNEYSSVACAGAGNRRRSLQEHPISVRDGRPRRGRCGNGIAMLGREQVAKLTRSTLTFGG